MGVVETIEGAAEGAAETASSGGGTGCLVGLVILIMIGSAIVTGITKCTNNLRGELYSH